MTTFEILKDFRALEELSNAIDEETGEFLHNEEDLHSFVVELKYHKEEKLDNIQNLKLEIEHKVEAIKSKIESLSKRKKHFENTIDKLINLQLMLLQGEKCKTDEWNFSFRKSESVDISPLLKPDDFDSEYVRTKLEFDKTKIKSAIKNGIVFDGVQIVEKQTLVVK